MAWDRGRHVFLQFGNELRTSKNFWGRFQHVGLKFLIALPTQGARRGASNKQVASQGHAAMAAWRRDASLSKVLVLYPNTDMVSKCRGCWLHVWQIYIYIETHVKHVRAAGERTVASEQTEAVGVKCGQRHSDACTGTHAATQQQ